MELLLEVKAYLLDLDEEYRGTENLEDTTYEVWSFLYEYEIMQCRNEVNQSLVQRITKIYSHIWV